jgi:hypothetical protein
MHFHLRICLLLAAALLSIGDAWAHRTRDFMETFDLSDLNYVGMHSFGCRNQLQTYAIVDDAEGFRHRVSYGQYIGKNHGVVKKIAPTHVVIEELVQNPSQNWFTRDVALLRTQRYRLEDHALVLLGKGEPADKQLKKRLMDCRELYGKDSERLACFDRAVGPLY